MPPPSKGTSFSVAICVSVLQVCVSAFLLHTSRVALLSVVAISRSIPSSYKSGADSTSCASSAAFMHRLNSSSPGTPLPSESSSWSPTPSSSSPPRANTSASPSLASRHCCSTGQNVGGGGRGIGVDACFARLKPRSWSLCRYYAVPYSTGCVNSGADGTCAISQKHVLADAHTTCSRASG